jgi:hypothetical protein
MSPNTIVCPHCKREIPLTEAVAHQVRQQLQADFDAQRRAQEKTFAEREVQLKALREQLEAGKKSLAEEVERRLTEEKKKLLTDARQQAEATLAAELQDLRAKLTEQTGKLAEAQKTELALRKQRRELEERQQALELEVARKLDAERAQIREAAQRAAAEEQRLRLGEKEKLIADLQRQIETLRQKAEQGSQQAQGEALELAFEDQLRASFPGDEITPVATGVRGADILQRVRTASGQDCGTIIWEAKRTRNWQKGWIAKLKEDQREHRAELAVLLTSALPPEVTHFAALDGVWVTDFACAVGLAGALRQGLLGVAGVRRAESGKKEKMAVLYSYLSSTEFRQRIEAIVEAFVNMKADLDAEKRAMAKQWAKREKQLDQVVNTTALMYGDLQGIIGQAALPGIKVLELAD